MVVFPFYEEASVIVNVSELSFRKSNSPELHDERLSSYVEVINFLLATYDADDITARAGSYLESCKQVPGMEPTEFVKNCIVEPSDVVCSTRKREWNRYSSNV